MSLRASLLRTLAAPAAPRRTYSFFSSKNGSGRYFNSSKPSKGTAAPPSQPQSSVTPPPTPAADASTQAVEAQPQGMARKDESRREKLAMPPSSSSPPPRSPPPHSTLSATTLSLHTFFALDRPLLLLPLAPTALFEPPAPAQIRRAEPANDDPPEASPEAEADAARLLSRALVMARVGGWAQWNDVLARLGDPPEEPRASELENLARIQSALAAMAAGADAAMDSTKRKRIRKMKKHKLRKRRRLLRTGGRKINK